MLHLTYGCATLLLAVLLYLPSPLAAAAQTANALEETEQSRAASNGDTQGASATSSALKTSEDWNRRIGQLVNADSITADSDLGKYRIGPDDVLEIDVFAAPELNRAVRVSSSGDISLPLLGSIRAAGLMPVV